MLKEEIALGDVFSNHALKCIKSRLQAKNLDAIAKVSCYVENVIPNSAILNKIYFTLRLSASSKNRYNEDKKLRNSFF